MGFNVGDVIKIEVVITEKMVQQFAEVSGDFNPIHMDEEYAKKTRFGRRIAHGMIAGALISRALAMELGSGGIYRSQALKFVNPMFIGDTVDVILEVRTKRGRGVATIGTSVVKKGSGEICVKGEALIVDGTFV
jgi:3-hydroxybutyryl-CoA dehydratase